jgi:K319L-like, PKD domain
MRNFSKITFGALLWISATFLFQACSKNEPTPAVTVTADAGPDATVDIGIEVTLDATGSSASDGSGLTYSWEFTSLPTSSGANLFITVPTKPTFTPDVPGQYVFTLTVSSGSASNTDVVTITAESTGPVTPIIINGSIQIDSVLTKVAFTGPDYRVTASLSLTANLTIMPGVIVEFESGTGIDILAGGSITAVGANSERISLTGTDATKGFWLGISIETPSVKNIIEFCDISGAGSAGFDGANLKAGIMVQGTGTLTLQNSSIKMSTGHGLYLRDFDVSVELANNVFTQNDYPAMALVHHFGMFDSASDYTGNGTDYIDNLWESNYTATDVTWQKLNVPYYTIGTPHRIKSAITIAAGVTIVSALDGGFDIFPEGSLTAVGTANEKITMKGLEDLTGYWSGINIQSNNTANKLIHVNIMNGGSSGFDGANLKANIMVETAGRLVIQNTVSSKSGGYGLYIRDLNSSIPDFSTNTFTANLAPVMCLVKNFSSLDNASDYTGNTNDYIESFWSNSNDIVGTHMWLNLNVPYRFQSKIEDIAGALTIEAGTTIISAQNGGLQVITGGSINATGTANQAITFKGEQDIVGFWRGLRFNAASSSNILDFVTVTNGGSSGFDGGNRQANIEVGPSGTAIVTNSTISKGGDAGIRVQVGGNLTQSSNTFTGNNGVDIETL